MAHDDAWLDAGLDQINAHLANASNDQLATFINGVMGGVYERLTEAHDHLQDADHDGDTCTAFRNSTLSLSFAGLAFAALARRLGLHGDADSDIPEFIERHMRLGGRR